MGTVRSALGPAPLTPVCRPRPGDGGEGPGGAAPAQEAPQPLVARVLGARTAVAALCGAGPPALLSQSEIAVPALPGGCGGLDGSGAGAAVLSCHRAGGPEDSSVSGLLRGLGPSGWPGLGLGVGLDVHLGNRYPQDGLLGVQEGLRGSKLLACKLRFPGLGGNCWPVTWCFGFVSVSCLCWSWGGAPSGCRNPSLGPALLPLGQSSGQCLGTLPDPSATPGCSPLLNKDRDNIWQTA